MKRKELYSDGWTNVSITNKRCKVIRHYNDTPDVINYIALDDATKLVDHIKTMDNDPNGMPSHVMTRDLGAFYKVLPGSVHYSKEW